ncbi:MAG: hypothetical protein AAF355_03670 [Myxococcota bacterium]
MTLPHGWEEIVFGAMWECAAPTDVAAQLASVSRAGRTIHGPNARDLRAAAKAAADARTFLESRDRPITHLAFLPGPDGGRLIWVKKTPNGVLLGIDDRNINHRVILSEPGLVENKPLIASEDGSLFALTMIDGLHVFDRDGRALGAVGPAPNTIQDYALSSSAGVLLIVTSPVPIGIALQPTTLHAYDLATLQPIWTRAGFHPFARIALFKSGTHLAVSRDTQVRVFQLRSDRSLSEHPAIKLGRLHSPSGPHNYLVDLKCSAGPSGRPIVAALSSTGTLRLYTSRSRRSPRSWGRLRKHRYQGPLAQWNLFVEGSLAFSPNGRFLGINQVDKERIFDLNAGRWVRDETRVGQVFTTLSDRAAWTVSHEEPWNVARWPLP